MEEHPSMVVKQEIFDNMINSSVALFRQIIAKQDMETETITQEEADFHNAFLAYAKELTEVVETQIQEENRKAPELPQTHKKGEE